VISWKNIREGSELLRVSRDGRFVVKRLSRLSVKQVYSYEYELTDLTLDKQVTVGTLQEARHLAEKWS